MRKNLKNRVYRHLTSPEISNSLRRIGIPQISIFEIDYDDTCVFTASELMEYVPHQVYVYREGPSFIAEWTNGKGLKCNADSLPDAIGRLILRLHEMNPKLLRGGF